METDFSVGQSVEMGFQVGGSTPPVYTMPIIECSQDQYDAMQTHDANTLYAITGGGS